VRVTKAVCDSFKELKEFKQEVFRVKSYFLVKE
jgi:predicted secreted protein